MIKTFEQALLKIAEMERKIETQQVLIDALVDQVKGFTKKQSCSQTHVGNEDLVCTNEKSADENPPGLEISNGIEDTPEEISATHISLEGEVKDMFRSKKAPKNLRKNLTPETFVAHAREYHAFSLKSKDEVVVRNPIGRYIKQNIDRIIRNLITNLNVYDMDTICSSLNLVSGEMDYNHRLVVAHDIILLIEDFSRMPFMISALFNNKDIRGDVFGRVIRRITVHQCTVDRDICKSLRYLVECYDKIIENLETPHPDKKSLEMICEELAVEFEIFKNGTFNQATVPNVYAMRGLCHYMDWDFTYNRFICSILHPRLLKSKNPVYVVYISVLAMNALRVFGRIESIDIIFCMLEEFMVGSDEISAVVYLFLKQVNPARTNGWFKENSKDICCAEAGYLEGLIFY